MVDEGDGG